VLAATARARVMGWRECINVWPSQQNTAGPCILAGDLAAGHARPQPLAGHHGPELHVSHQACGVRSRSAPCGTCLFAIPICTKRSSDQYRRLCRTCLSKPVAVTDLALDLAPMQQVDADIAALAPGYVANG